MRFGMKRRWAWVGLAVSLAAAGCVLAQANDGADFHEVYGLLRTNLPGVGQAELDAAALAGLIEGFASRVTLASNTPPSTTAPPEGEGPLLSESKRFEEHFAYVRVREVASGLADRFGEAVASLSRGTALQGLVLDLRFAGGTDYAETGRVADRFLDEDRLLLEWGEWSARATHKTNAFTQPLVILANRQTTGAAEALAAVLRHVNAGLIIGARTAGGASVWREFTLQSGYKLRVATTPVALGDGTPIPSAGLVPDIAVTVSPEAERQYVADPYRVLELGQASAGLRASTNLAAATNRPVRINEAELVRMKREGFDLNQDTPATPRRPPAAAVPLVTDPALARALDLLKGLAVVGSARRR
ncbi:MAG: hypothetical protein FJ387_16855 [Verrucomicrobia bacterium]|nr:hypothetical protein [Verrucomicrobiota bacterium]